MFGSIESIQEGMANHAYVADRAIATTIYLAQALGKPIFLEGEAGVGKTEVAKVLAELRATKLIRLQCYEGLDASHALYEWNYPKQILGIKLEQLVQSDRDRVGKEIFSEEYLIKRPLLEAISAAEEDKAPVLLIDEIDRADEEFEAFLLEVLSDFQITIPEIGTFKARHRPLVVLTSNRTREVHDALKRRCLYLWIPYPSFERELAIVRVKVPSIADLIAAQVCRFMQHIRQMDLYKRPGVAETLDWAAALIAMNKDSLDDQTVDETLGCILKYREDAERIRGRQLEGLVALARG